jgi:hypothetical protein
VARQTEADTELDRIWATREESIERGCRGDGELPVQAGPMRRARGRFC